MQRHGNWCTWDYRPCSRKLDFRITTPGSCGSLFPGHFTSYFSATLNFIFYFIPWNGLFHFHISFHKQSIWFSHFIAWNSSFHFLIPFLETFHFIFIFHSMKQFISVSYIIPRDSRQFISFSYFIPWNISFHFHLSKSTGSKPWNDPRAMVSLHVINIGWSVCMS